MGERLSQSPGLEVGGRQYAVGESQKVGLFPPTAYRLRLRRRFSPNGFLPGKFQHQAAHREQVAFLQVVTAFERRLVDERLASHRGGYVVSAMLHDGDGDRWLEPATQTDECGIRTPDD